MRNNGGNEEEKMPKEKSAENRPQYRKHSLQRKKTKRNKKKAKCGIILPPSRLRVENTSITNNHENLKSTGSV
jgi:hypothetical protein